MLTLVMCVAVSTVNLYSKRTKFLPTALPRCLLSRLDLRLRFYGGTPRSQQFPTLPGRCLQRGAQGGSATTVPSFFRGSTSSLSRSSKLCRTCLCHLVHDIPLALTVLGIIPLPIGGCHASSRGWLVPAMRDVFKLRPWSLIHDKWCLFILLCNQRQRVTLMSILLCGAWGRTPTMLVSTLTL